MQHRSHCQYENAPFPQGFFILKRPFTLAAGVMLVIFTAGQQSRRCLRKSTRKRPQRKAILNSGLLFFGVTNLHWCIKVPKESDEQELGMVYGSSLNEVLKSSRIRKTWGKHVTFNIIAMFSSSFRPVQFRPWTTSRENGRIFHLPALLISLAKKHDVLANAGVPMAPSC